MPQVLVNQLELPYTVCSKWDVLWVFMFMASMPILIHMASLLAVGEVCSGQVLQTSTLVRFQWQVPVSGEWSCSVPHTLSCSGELHGMFITRVSHGQYSREEGKMRFKGKSFITPVNLMICKKSSWSRWKLLLPEFCRHHNAWAQVLCLLNLESLTIVTLAETFLIQCEIEPQNTCLESRFLYVRWAMAAHAVWSEPWQLTAHANVPQYCMARTERLSWYDRDRQGLQNHKSVQLR